MQLATPLGVQISATFREENSRARCLSDANVDKIFLSVASIKNLSGKIVHELDNRITHWYGTREFESHRGQKVNFSNFIYFENFNEIEI